MTDITITENGKTISHIYSGRTMEDIAPYLAPWNSVYMIYDRNVKSFAKQIISRNPGVRANLAIDASEKGKSMETVMEICRFLLENGADRGALLLAIGGGITTDLAGFAASIYKRGIAFAYVPTTLLSQVDAAIGGKNGVNFLGYKNMIGTIRQSVFTFECTETLATLPFREFLGGAAEMLKTFIIDDSAGSYAKATTLLKEIYRSEDKEASIKENSTEISRLIEAAATIKAGFVSRDQFEKGERRKLNLGHTFAHAIEWESRKAEEASTEKGGGISHGEAVAIGMVLSAKISDTLGISQGMEEKLRKDFTSCGLPTDCPYPAKSLVDAMRKDKKAENGVIHFILIERIGSVVVKDLSADEAASLLAG